MVDKLADTVPDAKSNTSPNTLSDIKTEAVKNSLAYTLAAAAAKTLGVLLRNVEENTHDDFVTVALGSDTW